MNANKIKRGLVPLPDGGVLQAMIQEYPYCTVDHIISRYHGGPLDIGNVQMLKSKRNNAKGHDFWWRHPYLPTCQPFGLHHLPEDF